MSTHTFHPDTHEAGLQPGCPRCEEHADHPLAGLDSINLARLRRGEIHTDLDRKAAENIGEAEDLQRRFMEAAKDDSDEWAVPR